MTDTNVDVNNALADLRDAADGEYGKEHPDLKVIAEKFEAFRSVWVDAKVKELDAEQNPDGEEVEIDEKVEAEKPAAKAPSAKK